MKYKQLLILYLSSASATTSYALSFGWNLNTLRSPFEKQLPRCLIDHFMICIFLARRFCFGVEQSKSYPVFVF